MIPLELKITRFYKQFLFFGNPIRKVSTRKAVCPDSWSMLRKRDLKKLAKVFSFKKMTAANEYYILAAWTGMPKKFFDMISEIEVFSLVQFIYSDCVITHSRYKWHRFFKGPDNRLKNFTMDQFGLASLALKNYMATNDSLSLNQLCAICYRPFFLPFRTHMINLYISVFRAVPHYKKMAMLINFVALRNGLMDEYPNVFPKSKKSDAEDPFGRVKREMDWEHITMVLAGDRFGTVDQVRKSRITPILKFCEMQATDIKKKPKKK